MMPHLSVVVPVYRTAAFLRSCIDSILAQTQPDLELILVDDDEPGSVSGRICEQYQRGNGPVRVVSTGGRGVAEARRAGVQAARGTYVGFVDSDDWIEPDHFARLLEAARHHDADVAVHSRWRVTGRRSQERRQVMEPGCYRGDRLRHEFHGRMLSDRRSRGRAVMPALWLKLFRRDLLTENVVAMPKGLRHAEDVAISYPALLLANAIVVIDGPPTYHYRIRRRSIMGSHKPDYLEQCLIVVRHLVTVATRVARCDLYPHIATNLAYFAVHSLLNDSLAGHGLVSRARRARRACRHPEVHRALETYDPSSLPLLYRTAALLLSRQRYACASVIGVAYPTVVRVLREVV